MNTHSFILPRQPDWFRRAGVTECPDCNGRGSHWNGRGRGGNDPDSWDIECLACDGQGHHACPTCGFDHPVAGFDCLVCTTINELTDADLAQIDAADMAAAFTRSITAAKEAVA